jgi:hypothetical protein
LKKVEEPSTRKVFVKDDSKKVIDVEEHKELPAPKQNNNKGKTVTFIIPFACPGSGKSFCWDAISSHLSTLPNWSF